MTKSWFDEHVDWWPDLIVAARDEGYDEVDEYIYSDDARNDYINDELSNDDSSWRSVRDWLDGIDDSYYDFWHHDDWGEWTEADDETFYQFKTRFMDWMDENGYWEDEESDVDIEYDHGGNRVNETGGEEECDIPDEDFTVSDLMSDCGHYYQSDRIKQAQTEAFQAAAAAEAAKKEAEELDQAWDDFMKATEVA